MVRYLGGSVTAKSFRFPVPGDILNIVLSESAIVRATYERFTAVDVSIMGREAVPLRFFFAAKKADARENAGPANRLGLISHSV
jgi:hypothetical protein